MINLFQIFAILITIAALLSYINIRYVRLPNSIGLLLIALLISLAIQLIRWMGADIGSSVEVIALLIRENFNQVLIQGMLSFLLFAGALHINLEDLLKVKWTVSLLATLGVFFTALIIGTFTYFILKAFSLSIPIIYCYLFGALISPTDPIAVLAILKKLNISKSLEVKIAGESLFNDGMGVVLFLILYNLAVNEHSITVGILIYHFLWEVGGGIIFGLIIGWLTYRLLKNIDNFQGEVLLTLALASGGYTLANYWNLSGPIAVVISGLFIGNQGRRFAMSDSSREHLDSFWELIDEILTAILFVLIGLEVLLISIKFNLIMAGLCVIPLVLLSRFMVVGSIITFLRHFRDFSHNAIKILTWGGLRGGISIALALSLPQGEIREIILSVTYIVVVFTIIVQGLTLKRLFLRGL